MENSIINQLLQQFYTLWHENDAAYENWSKAHGLSLNTLLVLYSIYDQDQDGAPCTQKMICQKWVLAKQTVNTVLKDLEKNGYCTLTPIRTDKRNKMICLTETGKEFVHSTISELRQLELYVIEEMGEERMRNMTEGLATFVELFKKGKDKSK